MSNEKSLVNTYGCDFKKHCSDIKLNKIRKKIVSLRKKLMRDPLRKHLISL